nr:hypothetical protein [Tanacetum cinerariifolium]
MDIYNLINHYTDAKDICDNVKMLLEGLELTKKDQESQLMFRVDRIEVKGPIHEVEVQLGRHDNTIDEDVYEQPVQDLALNVDNVFQTDDGDAFDSDVDEAPMAKNMFMKNL